MKRTQLYLEESVWKGLEILAREAGVSVSELVRQAVKERYFSGKQNRAKAFRDVVGLWADRTSLGDSSSVVRSLRKGRRLDRVSR